MQTYHNQGGIIQGRAQLVREYVGNLQDNTEALRSNFSGSSAPESPAIGQTYFNITDNKEYTFTSNGWVPSDQNMGVYSEVATARGQLANLNARLSVALNEDGTLKVPAELGVDEWKDPVYGISYVSEDSFTISEDMTSVFTEGRAIKVVNGFTEVRTFVKSSEYSNQYNVTTVTTTDDVVEASISAVRYSIIQNGLPNNVSSMSSLIREPNTAYAEKVKVLLPSLNVSMCLQCTTAGTTASGDLTVNNPEIGNTVTDGTVVWTIKEIGGGGGLWTYDDEDEALQPKDLDELNASDLNTDEATLRAIVADVVDDRLEYIPIGSYLLWGSNNVAIPEGYLVCDGSEVSRTMYADLFDVIGITYGGGDGITTFNLPDYSDGKFFESDTTAGTVKQAGLPNIKGNFVIRSETSYGSVIAGANGAMYEQAGGAFGALALGGGNKNSEIVQFDASRSSAIYSDDINTVQPYSCTVRVLIKAFNGQTSDSALIDITQYAQALNSKVSKHELYEENFTIIYPNGGTAEAPANVSANSRYVEANPFAGYYVHTIPEIYYNGQWGESGEHHYYGSAHAGMFVKSSQLDDDSIVVQTGSTGLTYTSGTTGSPFGSTNASDYGTARPCRVKVWKIGKIKEENANE